MRLLLFAVLAAAAVGAYFWFTLDGIEQVVVTDPRPRLDHAREAAKRIEADGRQRVQDVVEGTEE